MRLKKGGAASAAPVVFQLGHGVVMTARVLDAFDHKLAVAESHAEMNALQAGEPTQRAWASFTAERRELLRTSEQARSAAIGWMHAVLLAAACATALDGVVDDETGEALAPSFETFELLFNDAGVEQVFRLQAFKVEQVWGAEKTSLGPDRLGLGRRGRLLRRLQSRWGCLRKRWKAKRWRAKRWRALPSCRHRPPNRRRRARLANWRSRRMLAVRRTQRRADWPRLGDSP